MRRKKEVAAEATTTTKLQNYAVVRHPKGSNNTQYFSMLIAFRTEKTMLQVSKETGIERANICRYTAKAIKRKELALKRKGICPITGYVAGFYLRKGVAL